MTVRIKFKATAWSSEFGSFGAGDLFTCTPEQARHFVEDAQAADYVQPPEPLADAPTTDAAADASSVAPAAPKRTRKA